MVHKGFIKEFTEEEYKEFFSWLLDNEDVKLEKEFDMSKALGYKNPNIFYTPEIKAFFETEPMQRIGRIGQLANVSIENPNAVHTRLEHCKGAYQKILDFYMIQFQKDEWKSKNSDEDSRLKILANMMDMASHDIGHTMCSHALEDLIGHQKGAHEILGSRILSENSEIQECFSRIHPQLSEYIGIVKDESYDLRTLKEGSIDFDRADFLVRDSLYLGVGQDGRFDSLNQETIPELLSSIMNGCEIRTVCKDSQDVSLPIFDYNVDFEIEMFLTQRAENYKKIYVSNPNNSKDIVLRQFCDMVSQYEEPNELTEFINKMKSTDIGQIDIEEYLKWDDIRFYNNVFKIYNTTQDQNLKDTIAVVLPTYDGLKNIVQHRIFSKIEPDIDENGNEINIEDKIENEEEKQFYLNVKNMDKKLRRSVSSKSRFENNCFGVSFKTEEERDNFVQELKDQNISDEVISLLGFSSYSIKKYNKKEPILIKDATNRIYSFDEYPNRKMDINPENNYIVFGLIPRLRFSGVSEEDIDKIKMVFFSKKEHRIDLRIPDYDTRFLSELMEIKEKEADER